MAPDTRTRGQRWADAVTSFGGSWLFIGTSQNRQNEEDRQRDEEDRAQLRLLHKRLDDIDAKLRG